MIEQIKEIFTKEEIFSGHFGIEREGLRCTKEGKLSKKFHPRVFGNKLSNPYITTDFSESQLEFITPDFKTLEQAYKFLEALYDIGVMEIGGEYIWPESMPCSIPEDNKIPVAKFCPCPPGEKASAYRKELVRKYGGKKQLLSGIHYNFSFEESFIKKLYKQSEKEEDFATFKNQIYLKITRNYLRYRWLIIYLLGSTSVMHESFVGDCIANSQKLDEESYSNEEAISYRNGECGYKNKVDLYPDYSSVEGYISSLEKFARDGLIEGPRELYSQIRLKAKDNERLIESLREEGIFYLEYRSIDINPFDKAGISLDDLQFLHLFSLYLLMAPESNYEAWQEEALENQKRIAHYGQRNIILKKDGESISREKWSLEILEQIKILNEVLQLDKEKIIDTMIEKVKDYRLTYAYQLIEKVRKSGYIKAHIELAKQYKKSAYDNRYKLVGYEDLELSTQLLMKEAIKRGIRVEVIDRSENFIALKKDKQVEYVKQATKTSKDSYITVLIMENKEVTKKILDEKHIKVPSGKALMDIDEAIKEVRHYCHQPVVIKPKSTNFGVGISIFKEGTTREHLIKALELAFKCDQTVLIEEFISGKEYRFLVVEDKVVGVLHRIPANVVGNGKDSIEALVAIKNQNPLRGTGYKKPLEKIHLDESAGLFLASQDLTPKSIPKEGQIIYLRENSNISTGGDSIDYTEMVCEEFKEIAISAAQAVSAKICGVDMMIQDIENEKMGYAVIELNFNPAIHIHSYPYEGVERNIAKEILKALGFIKNSKNPLCS